MNKYRKKPIVIDAMQVSRKYFDLLLDFMGKENGEEGNGYGSGEFPEDTCYMEIDTLEGTMTANEGDYIIKGVKGEFYPCKEDIFNLTYEKVDE